MRLWIVSDLHLELTRGWDLPPADTRPDFDVMVVAGDLIPRAERGVKWLLERVQDEPVVYVPGIHEAYRTDIDRTVEKAMIAAEGTKVFVLQDRWIRLGDVTLAGTPLWTDFALFGDEHHAMTVAADSMNDFNRIRVGRYVERFRPPHALARHRKSRAFLETELRKSRGNGRLVIVTHHAPMPGRGYWLAPHYPGTKLTDEEILTAAYCSDLTSLMWPAPIADGKNALRPADLWIYGHTRVVSNAKGYGPWARQQLAWDNPNFDPNFVIEI